ncbi:hypothetical protein [Natrinema sp. CBA1119]|uniref:hypothetical protein n=1 Tax=Natrinema sp. CBA1119 TaxID=1608465 RepID=UPI001145C91C|nr:hypothetical protein [Natrinema sp. CBA1119]
MNDSDQYRFHDGNLVLDEQPTDSVDRDEPIKPGEETGYRVAVKLGAIDVNARLRNIVQEYSQTLEFGTRFQVNHYVKKLSASDGELRIQTAAPNDPDNVQAYPLAEHNPSERVIQWFSTGIIHEMCIEQIQ